MNSSNSGWPPRQPRPGTGQHGPVLDMTPDGAFVEAPGRPFLTPVGLKLTGIAALVAVLAGATAMAFLALWLALQLIPIMLVAGVIGYGVLRFQAWRGRGSLFGGQRDRRFR